MNTEIRYNTIQYILYFSIAENLDDIENEDEEETKVLESTNTANEYQPQTSEVIKGALYVRSGRKSTIM